MTLEDIQVNDDVEVTYRGRVIHTSPPVRADEIIPGDLIVLRRPRVADRVFRVEDLTDLRSLRDTADTYGHVVIPKDAS